MEGQKGTQDPADMNLKLRLGLGRQEGPCPSGGRSGKEPHSLACQARPQSPSRPAAQLSEVGPYPQCTGPR